MKKSVMITGSTSGIGYEMAKVWAEEKRHLVLVGRNLEKLQKVQKELEQKTSISIICSDMGKSGSALLIYEETKRLGIQVETLINNAGAGYVGEFIQSSEQEITDLMTLNMINLTLLIRYFAQEMVERKRGEILNVASTGAYHPGPYTALYYATKAYVLSLSEALSEEVKPYGVCVSVLCPGATATGFAKAVGRQETNIAMHPAIVARKAYKGLKHKKTVIIPGIRNQLFVKIPRFLAKKIIGIYQLKLKK